MLTALKKIVFSLLSPQQRFRRIYRQNHWGSAESVSGPGSELATTEKLRDAVVTLIKERAIKSIVDVPCGDFNWMRYVVDGVDYTGIDIVPELIGDLQQRYSSGKTRFEVGDLIKGVLPKADLVICRDCFIHLSFADTISALATIRRSNSTYLLTNSYPAIEVNHDIVTGRFRLMNLSRAPYRLPPPLLKITENEPGKEIWLWKIRDL